MNLSQFLDQLDTFSEPVSLSILQGLLTQLEFTAADLEECQQFCDEKYQRNLMRRSANYEALLLCFEAGQRTPIHDHAGSACAVKVIEGIGVETIFETTADGWLFATGSQELTAGGVVGSDDMDTHQLSNLQPEGRRLVTLHIYSPPLSEVGNYSITDNQVTKVTAPTADANLVFDRK